MGCDISTAFWRPYTVPPIIANPTAAIFSGRCLIAPFKKKGKERRNFPCGANSNAVREALYVDDQISAILAANEQFENQIVNCAANAPITIGEAARAICDVLDWRAPIVSPANSFQGTQYKVLDSSLFLQRTGWRPSYSLVEGLRRLYAIEYEKPQGGDARERAY